MHYKELARKLAEERQAPLDAVTIELGHVIRWHGWAPDLDDDQIAFVRTSVAQWGDDLEGTA